MTVETDTSLRVSRLIQADAETVFRAWTEPGALRQWSCPEGSDVEDVQVDLRVGGKYRIRMKGPEGEVHTAVGTYRTIEPAKKLVYTWDWEENDHKVGESQVTVEFHQRGEATEVVLTHERFPNGEATKLHELGWTSCLNRLESRYAKRS